jgi:hypothetical protein
MKEQRRDQRTAPRQDIGGPELIVTRKIVITTSRIVNKQCNRSSDVISDLTQYIWCQKWDNIVQYITKQSSTYKYFLNLILSQFLRKLRFYWHLTRNCIIEKNVSEI